MILRCHSIFDDAYAHSMFNSAEKFHYGGYRVQVATAPEFPQIDEPSQFLVKVTEVVSLKKLTDLQWELGFSLMESK